MCEFTSHHPCSRAWMIQAKWCPVYPIEIWMYASIRLVKYPIISVSIFLADWFNRSISNRERSYLTTSLTSLDKKKFLQPYCFPKGSLSRCSSQVIWSSHERDKAPKKNYRLYEDIPCNCRGWFCRQQLRSSVCYVSPPDFSKWLLRAS